MYNLGWPNGGDKWEIWIQKLRGRWTPGPPGGCVHAYGPYEYFRNNQGDYSVHMYSCSSFTSISGDHKYVLAASIEAVYNTAYVTLWYDTVHYQYAVQYLT